MFFVPQLCGGISIHALREEGDRKQRESHKHKEVFLSTPSARRATVSQALNFAASVISIHALREEGDAARMHRRMRTHLISIHALREEGDGLFFGAVHGVEISIHALREEGDVMPGKVWNAPHGISIHALREEGDARSAAHITTAR